MSEWIEHDGSGMPVPGDTVVIVKFRDGHVSDELDAYFWDDGDCFASNWVSSGKNNPEDDIIAYRLAT